MTNKNDNYLKIPGLFTASWLVFLYGFVNGRCKTAEINPDSGVVTSAYIIGKMELFDRMTKNYVVHLETGLHETRVAVEKFILEFKNLQDKLQGIAPDESVQPGHPVDYPDAHAQRQRALLAEKANAEKRKYEARCFEILLYLGELRASLRSEERVAEETIWSTAHTLRDKFGVYCHGVLLKAVYVKHIPEIVFEHYLDGYRSDHAALMKKLDEVLESTNYEEVE